MKRRFKDYTLAEDFINELVMGDDDPTIVGELVEVWRSEAVYEAAYASGAWGQLYAVWGTEEEVEAEMAEFGDWIDRKGMTAKPEQETA